MSFLSFSTNPQFFVTLWVAAAVVGFFVGLRGAHPHWGWYVAVFLIFDGVGLLTFLAGSVLGAVLSGARVAGTTGPGHVREHTSPPARAVSASTRPPVAPARSATPATAPGWYPDRGDPHVQQYWDGASWGPRIVWRESEWVPA